MACCYQNNLIHVALEGLHATQCLLGIAEEKRHKVQGQQTLITNLLFLISSLINKLSFNHNLKQ